MVVFVILDSDVHMRQTRCLLILLLFLLVLLLKLLRTPWVQKLCVTVLYPQHPKLDPEWSFLRLFKWPTKWASSIKVGVPFLLDRKGEWDLSYISCMNWILTYIFNKRLKKLEFLGQMQRKLKSIWRNLHTEKKMFFPGRTNKRSRNVRWNGWTYIQWGFLY